jgi:Skp family chaperone for outer membrane proteins
LRIIRLVLSSGKDFLLAAANFLSLASFALFFGVHMKPFRQSVYTIIFVSTITLVAAAQSTMNAPTPTNNDAVPAGKVAVVDSRLFYEQTAGIQKLIRAYQQLATEFVATQAELQNLQNRIITMNNEINKMGATPAAKAKEEEVIRLQRDLTYKQQEAETAYNKRRVILVQPIQAHIGKALQEFIAARGITLLLDSSKLEGAILAALPAIDVTQAFIADYNLKHAGTTNAASR